MISPDDSQTEFTRRQIKEHTNGQGSRLTMRHTLSPRNILFGIVIVVLIASVPFALVETHQTGEIYIFSRRFIDELPKRLTGPGRLRFILQPLAAIIFGNSGRSGRCTRRPSSVCKAPDFGSEHRLALVRSGISEVAVLGAMAILLDAVSQFLIYRQVHPGAALIVGPVLIAFPYAATRAFANRWVSHFQKNRSPENRNRSSQDSSRHTSA